MSRNPRVVKEQLSDQAPSSSRRSVSTYPSEYRLPPPPSSTNDDGEEVDLEAQPESAPASEPSIANRWGIFSGNKNVPPPESPVRQPSMAAPESFRAYGSLPPSDATPLVQNLLDQQRNSGPSETECTWAKILCLPGCALFSAGSSYLGFVLWLAAQGMKDIEKTHIVCCSEAIAGTALACGCCLACAGVATALATKRR